MKIVIAAVIAGTILLGIGFGFFILSDTEYEIVEKKDIHPCQELTLDIFLLYAKSINTDRYLLSLEELDVLLIGYESELEVIEQLLIENNCESTRSEWNTVEFQNKVKFLIDNGFLP